ncbi:MAG: OmpW family protein [Halobacteria archaeon]|nr:OmpW family protein [Halobacteria archaeon]
MTIFKLRVLSLVGLVSLALVSTTALAVEAGDWIIRGGITVVSPNSDSSEVPGIPGSKVEVDDGTALGINFGYFFTDNWAIEVLLATPFTHDIKGSGSISSLGKIGEIEMLPPTVNAQYHFMPQSSIKPYVGAGLTYFLVLDESTSGALAGTTLNVDNSLGVGVQAGVDFMLDQHWLINLDLRYIALETDASVGGGSKFDVTVDPWVYTLAVGYKF